MQEGLRGGNWEHGLLMGAVSGAGGAFLTHHGRSLGKGGMIVANAVLSGTVSEIGGGKFANGAITGAFAVMFNDLMHNYKVKRRKFTFKLPAHVPYDNSPASMANVCLKLKVSIIETHYANGNVSIDGIGIMEGINGVTISPSMTMTINADNDSGEFFFSKQYSGASVTQQGYSYFGEVHTGILNLSKYHSVTVTLSPGFIRSDPGMGRGVPTLPGIIGIFPTQWFMKQNFRIK